MHTKVSIIVKFGLSDSDWALLQNLAIAPLKKAGCKIFVFGSRARGDHKKFSDLDLLIDSPEQVPLASLGDIRADLEESNLPIKVDLVLKSELADSFRDGVMKERIEV